MKSPTTWLQNPEIGWHWAGSTLPAGLAFVTAQGATEEEVMVPGKGVRLLSGVPTGKLPIYR